MPSAASGLEGSASRSVARVVKAVRTVEGAGFVVHRPFPTVSLEHVDPFLLLDEMGPVDLTPGEAQGAPDHPHRGFETVTYVLEGRTEHRDSAGNEGSLGPGDVQWMTAGAGVVHSEMPEAEFARTGGRMHGIQLWVNLPARHKMTPPRYQELRAAQVPKALSPDGGATAQVIAGEAFGVQAAVQTHTPVTYLHFKVRPGAAVEQPAPREQNAMAYVLSGRGRFGADTLAGPGELVIFGPDSDWVTFGADGDSPMELLFLSARPLGEPVARYGPFVMNTRHEILQAVEDYQSGKMGRIG